jgi:amino acid transporter
MASQMSEEQIYEEARKRVKAKKDFYGHLTAWAIVNFLLIVIWALSSRGYPWFLWPLCFWGIFVFVNYLRVFVFKQKSDRSAIEKEVDKIKKEQS